jgi:hypothetical protein
MFLHKLNNIRGIRPRPKDAIKPYFLDPRDIRGRDDPATKKQYVINAST